MGHTTMRRFVKHSDTVNDYETVIKRFTLVDMTNNDEIISIYKGTDKRLCLNTFGSWFITLRTLTLKSLKQMTVNHEQLGHITEKYKCIFDKSHLAKTYKKAESYIQENKNTKIGDIIAFFLLGGWDSHIDIIQKISVKRQQIENEKKRAETQWSKQHIIGLIEKYSDSHIHNQNYDHLGYTDLLFLLNKII